MKKLLIRYLLAALVGCMAVSFSFGQNGTPKPANDSLEKRLFKKLDIFPAVSYAPETKLTLGVIGIKYFDLSGGDLSTPVSNAEFLAIYTLNKQVLVETRWEAFTTGQRWRTRGELFFNRFPDRNYGLGNDANALVVEFDGEGVPDTLNYYFFNSDRIKFSPVVLRQLRKNLYLGPQYDMEYLFNLEPIAEGYEFLNDEARAIDQMAVDGLRSGLGIQLLYDSRDRVLNPLRGSLIEFNNLYYGKYVGSDFAFSRFHLDAR